MWLEFPGRRQIESECLQFVYLYNSGEIFSKLRLFKKYAYKITTHTIGSPCFALPTLHLYIWSKFYIKIWIHLFIRLWNHSHRCWRDMVQVVEILPQKKQEVIKTHNSQYCCCSWPRHARSQGISIHGIVIVLLEYSRYNVLMFSWWIKINFPMRWISHGNLMSLAMHDEPHQWCT